MRKLIWKGSKRKAPEIPPIEVKKEIVIATRGGNNTFVFTPETGKRIFKKSTLTPPEKMPELQV